MAGTRRFLSPRHRRPDPRVRWPRRRHIEFDPARFAAVRFASFEQESPFPVAKIDIVESRDATTVKTEALGEKVLELSKKLKRDGRKLPAKVDRYLSQLNDLEMLAALVASTFVNDALRRQRILEEPSLNQRLRLLITFLQDEIGSAAA